MKEIKIYRQRQKVAVDMDSLERQGLRTMAEEEVIDFDFTCGVFQIWQHISHNKGNY